MSDRPDYVKCIQHTHADLKGQAWCGRLCSMEWVFQSLDHATYNAASGGYLVACPECVHAVMSCFQSKGSRWIEGFEAAEKEFTDSDSPAYANPYPAGDPAHDGYEEAVYIFTQK